MGQPGYIILKDFKEYQKYVPIKRVSHLHNRITKLNKNAKINKTAKQRIRLGLPLTKIECEQITNLSLSVLAKESFIGVQKLSIALWEHQKRVCRV